MPLVLVELFMSLFWLTCRGSRPDNMLQRVGEQYLYTSGSADVPKGSVHGEERGGWLRLQRTVAVQDDTTLC